MPMPEVLTALGLVTRAAKALKEEAARQHGAGPEANLSNDVLAYRGGRLMAMVRIQGHLDRDMALQAVDFAAKGWGADVVAMLLETWQSTLDTNPVTGKPWGPREMTDLAENHDGVAKGWIRDAVSVFAVDRTGEIASDNLLYRWFGNQLVWEPEDRGPITQHRGYLVDRMRDAMTAPVFDPETEALPGDLQATDAVERRALTDAGFAAVLQRVIPCTIAFVIDADNPEDLRRARMIRSVMPGAQMMPNPN